MKYDDDNEKLGHARKLFEDAVDHCADAHTEAHRAERFYHNTECVGQWEAEDIEYLRDAERPVFSFNIVKSKLDTFLGMYADAERTPVVAATGGEPSDVLMSEVINALKDKVLDEANYETLKARQLKTGTISGECDMHIEVEPDPEGEGWVKVNLYRILPFEIHWDISSVEPDRKDARYVFWDRWFDKAEFKEAYPDYAKEWDVMSKRDDDTVGISDVDTWSETNSDSWSSSDDDYNQERHNRYYYDRRKRKMRVVRYEYMEFETKYYAVDADSKQKTEIDKATKERVELAQAMGMGISVLEKRVEVVKVCEFAGMTLLAEYESAGPFDGFSLVPYCYDVDEETGTAYGFCRNLFDPQQEFNKSKSLEIEYMAQGTAPGVMAEEGSIGDETAFSQQLRQAGGIAMTKKNAIVEGRVAERQPSPPSAALMSRASSAMELMSEVSAIPSASNLTAAEHMQSGVTVAIKYNKTKQAVSTPFSHHEDAQKSIVKKVVQAITRSMPDDQIESILASEGKYQIGNGRIVEMVEGPPQQQQQQIGQPGQQPQQQQPQQPQMVPKAMANLRDIQSVKYNLDMDYASENSTLRMMELEILLQMHIAGVPIDPEVLVEKASPSRSTRDRLKKYAEDTQKAQAEGLQAQNEALKAQNDTFAAIENAKTQETTRHNTTQEKMDAMDMQIKERLKHLEIWEKADENEKGRLMDMAKFAIQQRQTQSGAQYNGA